jgi:thiol-disulfide isomerase/thioredoxin
MESLDRKTFILSLLIAVAAILAGVYFITLPLQKNEAPKPARREVPATLPSSPNITDVKTDAEASTVLESGPKVVLLHTPWCGHCRNMMPSFVEAASKDSKVKWVRVDGNIAPSLVKRGDVKGFPTVFGVDSTGKVTQMSGGRDTASLLTFAAAQAKEVVEQIADEVSEEEE